MISITSGSIKKTANEVYNKNQELNEDLKNNLDNFDLLLLSKLNNLRNSLGSEKINFPTVKQQIRDIANFDKSQNFDYLNNLLHPEKVRGCKIPSQVPVPSCAFQLHNCITIQTNSSGCIGVLFNPFFLANDSALGKAMDVNNTDVYVHKFLTSLWVNKANTLSGSMDDNNWEPVNIGQTLPSVYDQYRLVSASMVVKYIGRLDSAQGVIGGAIIYDDLDSVGGQVQVPASEAAYDPAAAGANTVCPQIAKYGNFDLAMDSFYHQTNSCLEGVRMLYFPVDNNYEEYTTCMDEATVAAIKVGTTNYQFSPAPGLYKGAFNWFFYGLGCPANTNCFKIDIYCNFECLPKAKFLNYMPITLNPYVITNEEKKKMIMFVQNKPVLKETEEPYSEVLIPSLFNRMIKKFDNGLPGFEKLKMWGLLNSVPGLKSGLALAGNMIASSNQMDFE